MITKRSQIEPMRLKRDIDALRSAKRRFVRAGSDTSVIDASYSIRDLPENATAILYLIHIPKKNVRRAHERNRIKRWIREAIRNDASLSTVVDRLSSTHRQVLLLIRITVPPSIICNYTTLRSDIAATAEHIQNQLSQFK